MAKIDPNLMRQFMPGMQMPMDPSAAGGGGAGGGLQLGLMGGPMADVGAAGVGNPQAGGIPNLLPPDMGGAAGIPNMLPPGGGGAAPMPNFYPAQSVPNNPQQPPADMSMSFGGASAGLDQKGGQPGAQSPFAALGDAFKSGYESKRASPGTMTDGDMARIDPSAREKLIRALMGMQ